MFSKISVSAFKGVLQNAMPKWGTTFYPRAPLREYVTIVLHTICFNHEKINLFWGHSKDTYRLHSLLAPTGSLDSTKK